MCRDLPFHNRDHFLHTPLKHTVTGQVLHADPIRAPKDHFKPAPKTIAERFKFSRRVQHPAEIANSFVAALCTITVNCKFTSDLEKRIGDQFIFGLSSKSVQRQLFTKGETVTLTKVIAAAVAQEGALASRSLVRSQQHTATTTEQVHKVKSPHQHNFQKRKKGHFNSQPQVYQPQSTTNSQANKNFGKVHNDKSKILMMDALVVVPPSTAEQSVPTPTPLCSLRITC